jgi:hypothetical protein
MNYLTSPATATRLALLACSIALAAPLRAAVISWSSPTGITGDSDVSTSGTGVYAYNFGATGVTSTTVNGVTFSPFTISTTSPVRTSTIGSVTLAEIAPEHLWGYNTLGAGSAPFTNLSLGYRGLLSSAGSASNPATITVTLSGLDAGKTYQLQWWASNTAGIQGISSETLNSVTATSGTNAITLSARTGLGEYALGTFVADATSQTFTLNSPAGATAPLINALQLRDITPTGVPDTASTLPIVGLSLIGAMALNRRRSPRVRA